MERQLIMNLIGHVSEWLFYAGGAVIKVLTQQVQLNMNI